MNRDKGLRAAVARLLLWVLFLGALLGCPGVARAQVPPNQHWKSFETAHFRVTFPEGLDSLGLIAGVRAEEAWEKIARAFVAPPGGRIELLLSDHADFSNGSASVAPYRRITIFAHPPVDGGTLSHFDDWVQLVVTHELTHVFHLDQGGTLSSVLRAVFGRPSVGWPFFPQHAQPRWVVEGMATWYESALTQSGRVRGTQQETELRTALLEGSFEGLDQASGESPVWPSGNRPYIYGAEFLEYLSTTYGDEHLADFVRAVGGAWIPFRMNAAARKAFGVSFSRAWDDWERAFAEEVSAQQAVVERRAPLTRTTPVTRSARQALYPQVSPDGRTLLFAFNDGKTDTQLRISTPEGAEADQLTRTNGLSVFSWLPDGGVLFAQFHLVDTYRIVSDLHVREADGDERQVTEDARLDQPSATPDGRSAVAVRTIPGATSLVEVDLGSGAVRELATEDRRADWAYPRVSPDGRWIAASRWLPGAYFDVVILDRSGRVVSEVTRDRALDIAPFWSPDGRWLVWSSDRSGIPNLLGASVDPASGRAGPVRQVTNVLTGAFFPSVDPGSQWIYFSASHSGGLDVARIPFDPTQWTDPFPEDPRFQLTEPLTAPPPLGAVDIEDYSPLPTLRPRYWEPVADEAITAFGRTVIGTRLGLRTSSEDLVGRHRMDVSAAVATGGEVDASAAYRFQGFEYPIFSFAVQQLWDADGPLLGERTPGVVDTLFIKQREREASASMTLRSPGFRKAATLTLGGGMVWERQTLLDRQLEPETRYQLAAPSSRLADLRASFAFSTARSYAFSNGAGNGVSLTVQARRRLHLGLADSLAGRAGRDRGFDEATGRLTSFISLGGPGYAHHVFALRATGGAARGPATSISHFRIGGASGGRDPVTGYSLLGDSYLLPVRGYSDGVRRGRYAATVSAEYRFPLFLINRGIGAWPLHFDRTYGSLFVDAGNAWDGPPTQSSRALVSAGAEVMLDMLVFFNDTVTLRAGIGVPFVDATTPVVYLRFGRAF